MGISNFFKKPSIEDLKARKDVGRIIKIFQSDNGKQAMEAASALAQMGGEKGAAALLQAVTSLNPNVRAVAAFMFGMINDPDALPFLLKVITNKTLPTAVRAIAINSVGSIKKPDALEALTSLLDAPETELQVSAAYAIGELGIADEKAVAALLLKCEDAKSTCRHAATVALGGIKDPRALTFIKKLLNEEKEPGSRVELIRALGDLGGEEPSSILAALLESPGDRGLSTEIEEALKKSRT